MPSTTPLEGSGRDVHERERPGVGWNPLSLTEGEGDWGCGRKNVRSVLLYLLSSDSLPSVFSSAPVIPPLFLFVNARRRT